MCGAGLGTHHFWGQLRKTKHCPIPQGSQTLGLELDLSTQSQSLPPTPCGPETRSPLAPLRAAGSLGSVQWALLTPEPQGRPCALPDSHSAWHCPPGHLGLPVCPCPVDHHHLSNSSQHTDLGDPPNHHPLHPRFLGAPHVFLLSPPLCFSHPSCSF